MYINQQDGQNYVIRLYFPLDALHVSDSISPSSGATYFYKLYIHLVYADTIRLAGYSHTTARRMVPAYTGIYQMRCTAYKVAPDDGLIQSETCRASNGK